MALIDSTILLGIADRGAEQYNLLQEAFGSAKVEGSGFYFDRVTATNDPDVEIPTETSYHAVDDDMDVDIAVRATALPLVVTAMAAHFNVRENGVPLQTGGWDGYLTSHDDRVSWWFNRLYNATKRRLLLSSNVFSESEDVFATIEVLAGPSLGFTDGINYGNGNPFNLANGSNYAATQLKVVVESLGASDLDLRLGVKDINDLPATIDVTVPGSSISGTEILVGTTSDRYLDVISVSYIPFSSFGTLGDKVTVQNSKERQIAL